MSNRRRTRKRLTPRRPGEMPPGAEVRSASITDETGRDVSGLFGIPADLQGPVNGSLGPLRLAGPGRE